MLQKQVREVNMQGWGQQHRWGSMSRDSEKFCKNMRNYTTVEELTSTGTRPQAWRLQWQSHWRTLLTNPLKSMTIFSEGKKMEISREILDFSNSWSTTSELDGQLLFWNIFWTKRRNEQIYSHNLSPQHRDVSACDSSPHEGCGHNCGTDITYICSAHINLYSNCADACKGFGIKGLLKRAICSPIALLQYKLYREAISWSQ